MIKKFITGFVSGSLLLAGFLPAAAVTVEVTDNGKGISELEMRKPQAFGIRGLHERAKTVGGWLDVSTREGAGTSIILSVPLDSPADKGGDQ